MDIKDKAIKLLVDNLPKLGKFYKSAIYVDIGTSVYNPVDGSVTSQNTQYNFKGVFIPPQSVGILSSFPVTNIEDSIIKKSDVKVIVAKGNISFEFKNDNLVKEDSFTYKILAVYNVSDVAYICYLRKIDQ